MAQETERRNCITLTSLPGQKASKIDRNDIQGQPVHIRYRDHLLFKNVGDPSHFQPSIRECVGWVLKENDQAVYLVWDRAMNPQRHETPSPGQSGLVILKSEILEMKIIG